VGRVGKEVGKKGSASFLKKRSKKLFLYWARAGFAATGPAQTKVFAPLFSKSGRFLNLA
jgi:hypothetical protein